MSLAIGAGILVAVAGSVAVLVAFGTAKPKPPRETDNALRRVDYRDLPPQSDFVVRDGARIAYRVYPGGDKTIALLIHGSTSRGRSMHALARYLAREGVATAYAIDVRGHGATGPSVEQAGAYRFLAPLMGPFSPTNRPGYGGWATPYMPRIIGLTVLNKIGITAYSWNLSTNFRPFDDYRAAFERLRRPAVVDHLGLIIEPAALETIKSWMLRLV